MDSLTFEVAVLWMLNKKGLSNIPMSQRKVGYISHSKADTTTIYDYKSNDVEWDQFALSLHSVNIESQTYHQGMNYDGF